MISKTRNTYHTELEDAKKHLRLDSDFTDDNEYVNGLIETATMLAENYIEKCVASTTCVMTLNEFSGGVIKVPEGNFQSVTTVEGDSVEATVDFIRIYDDHFEIVLTENISVDELVVTYEAGYAAGACPKPIQQAIMIKIADLYDVTRSSFTLGMQNNQTFEMILDHYRSLGLVHYRTT